MKAARLMLLLLLTVNEGKADETAPKKIVLPPDWTTLEIGTGGGSCWGESTGVYLTLNKTEGGGTVAIRTDNFEEKPEPREVDAEELRRIVDRLVAYCSYFSDNGYRAPNYWLLHRIEFSRAGSEKRELMYEGPSLVQDPKSGEFHKWLRSLHPMAEPLAAESYWIERREREKSDTEEKRGEQVSGGNGGQRR